MGERLNGFAVILKGYLHGCRIGGDQWNEGDVSCCRAARLLAGQLFRHRWLAGDLYHHFGQMELYPAIIEQENQRYGPFLATTTVLMKPSAQAPRAGARGD